MILFQLFQVFSKWRFTVILWGINLIERIVYLYDTWTDEEGVIMKIRSKEEVISAYSKRYPELDYYFISNLEQEYDKYYNAIKDMKSLKEVEAFFNHEIEKNDASFKDAAGNGGLEDSLNSQYMAILANYGLIVFFRDTMIEYDRWCE